MYTLAIISHYTSYYGYLLAMTFTISFTEDKQCAPDIILRNFRTLTIHARISKAATETNAKFSAAIQRGMAGYKWHGSERDEIFVLFGKRGATERLLASNIRVRRDATFILADQLHQLREKSLAIPNRTFWHVSFLGPIITEYKPEIDVDAFRHTIYRLLNGARLNAVFAIELQAITNYPQRGQGRGFLMNAHAACWSDDPAFDAKAAAATMRDSQSLFSELGADTVKITQRTLDPGELEYLAHYMLKAPFDAKRRARHDEVPTRWIFKPATARDDQLLRLGELISHFEFTDLVWGIGEGTAIRAAWKKQLVKSNVLRCTRLQRTQTLDRDFDINGLWAKVRKRGNGSCHYQPLCLFGPRPRPIAGTGDSRQGGTRLRPSQRAARRADEVTVLTPRHGTQA